MAAVANQVHSTAQQIGARIGWKESVENGEGIQKRASGKLVGLATGSRLVSAYLIWATLRHNRGSRLDR